MLQRLSPASIPELSLYCLNSYPVPGRTGQVAYSIKCVMLFPSVSLRQLA